VGGVGATPEISTHVEASGVRVLGGERKLKSIDV
jgi:hypothetical protein